MRKSSLQVEKPTAIENELRQIDKFKEKQKVELGALIQHNLANLIKRKENEEKSLKYKQGPHNERSSFNRTNTSKINNYKFKKIKNYRYDEKHKIN